MLTCFSHGWERLLTVGDDKCWRVLTYSQLNEVPPVRRAGTVVVDERERFTREQCYETLKTARGVNTDVNHEYGVGRHEGQFVTMSSEHSCQHQFCRKKCELFAWPRST